MANKPNTKPKGTPTVKHPSYVLQGLVSWCKVFEPDDNGKYTLDLTLDKKGIELMSKYGIPIKNKDDGRGTFASFQAYSKDPEGEPLIFSDKVFDAAMKPFTGGLIGNGSLVNVEFFPKDWNYQGKSGTSARLLSLQVLKHVKYGGSKLKVETEFVEASDESSPFTSDEGNDIF